MNQDPVRVRLDLAVDDERLIAVVAFTNESAAPVYLESAKTGLIGERLDQNLFHIHDGDERVPFAGRMVKRPPPGPDEFTLLGPSETMESRVRLDPWYRFPRTEREYQVFYRAINASRESQDLFKLESNRVSVRYRGWI